MPKKSETIQFLNNELKKKAKERGIESTIHVEQKEVDNNIVKKVKIERENTKFKKSN